jgi:hypothetical protein
MPAVQHAVVHGQLRHWTIETGTVEPIRRELVTLPAVLDELSQEGWEVYWVLERSNGEMMVFLRLAAGL